MILHNRAGHTPIPLMYIIHTQNPCLLSCSSHILRMYRIVCISGDQLNPSLLIIKKKHIKFIILL